MQFRVLVLALSLSVLAFPSGGWTRQAAPTLTILSSEGRRSLPLAVVDNQDYVAVDDLAGPFGTAARDVAGGLTITARGRTIVVTANQNVVSVAGRLVSLPAPALRRDGRWYVPVDFLPRALSLALDLPLDLRRPSRLLVSGDLRVPRVAARVEAGSTGTTVTFDVTPVTSARVNNEGGRLVVLFDADALDLNLSPVPQQGFLSSIASGDAPNTVVLMPGAQFAAYRSSSSQPDASSSRLVVELMAGTSDLAAAAPTPPAPDTRPSINPIVQSTGMRTIVIDPGHGGDEVGTQGSRGTLEKDITLAVARRLRTLIESRLGLRVFLTREDDRTISLDDRSAFANSQQADVFLSIHANAAARPVMKGAEVYYLSADRAGAEARAATEDDAASLPALGGGTRTIDLILWESAQGRFLQQSGTLAGLIEQALSSRVAMSPRAVQQAPLRVLVGANMPAVLVEIGYLSSPEQEQQLTTAAFQDAVAESLFEALVKFRGLVEQGTP